jgi:septum formation protein
MYSSEDIVVAAGSWPAEKHGYNGSMALILASASPRRRELLRAAGIDFVVDPADLPEVPLPEEGPREFAERMAREKAAAVYRKKGSPDVTVLGADTVVFVNGTILNKPENAEDAARMLRLISGRSHQVITGVCLKNSGIEDVRSETTSVHVRELNEIEIREYIATGEPMDKAGAYGIQGIASRWIPRIEGCYFNVVGLPVALVWRMLKENGVSGD